MASSSAPALGLLLLLTPGLALAAAEDATLNCRFAQECLDEECAPSDYEADLVLTPMTIDAGVATLSATFEDPSESFKLAGMDQNGLMRLFNLESAAGARLLTIWPDGTARYTTHIADPASSITYGGRCEEPR
ncbi:MAG: hypothetical protein ACK5IP_00565 [Paracoccus sp. (in: a-proteobacteria)]